MKKSILLITSIIILLFVISCQDNFDDTTFKENILSSEFMMNIQVKNGLLYFENLEDFLESQILISDNKDRIVSSEELNEWEDNIGFRSMRRKYYDISEAFSFVENDNDLSLFTEEYGNDIFDDSGSIQMPINNKNRASVLDENGKVLIGDNLHCFIDNYQIIITDQDESKLNRALNTLESSEENGIYVLNINEQNSNSEARSCSPYLITTTKYGFDKKLSAKWEITTIVDPIITDFGPNSSLLVFWITNSEIYTEMKSERKANNLFGNKWKGYYDLIRIATNYSLRLNPGSNSPSLFATASDSGTRKAAILTTTDVTPPRTIITTSLIAPPQAFPEFNHLNGEIENVRLGLLGLKSCPIVQDPCAGVNCPSGSYCDNGNCIQNNPQCVGEGDCLPGEECINGQCQPF